MPHQKGHKARTGKIPAKKKTLMQKVGSGIKKTHSALVNISPAGMIKRKKAEIEKREKREKRKKAIKSSYKKMSRR
tara:strand:- start:68 stop:295 length:228 start_codon:yes stop_codon:yes gene_type:complete